MRLTFNDEQIAVFDDVLSEEAFGPLWVALQDAAYEPVHRKRIEGVWRLLDGEPLRGETVVATAIPLSEVLPPGVDVAALPVRMHPTGGPIDAVVGALRAAAPQVHSLIGAEGRDWLALVGAPFIYPMETGLSWHCDGGMYSGAFIYYAHPRWNALWGGELLVAERCPDYEEADRAEGRRNKLDDERESTILLRAGFGRFVMPKPNRLVFLAGGTPHMITKVARDAGNHPRVSFAGFFVKAEGIAELIAHAS